MPEQLPISFVDVISTGYGRAGEGWLAGLPFLIANIEQDWRISVGEHYPNLSYHFVAPCICQDGTEAVLKIGFPEENREMDNEAGALRLVDGDGMVKLLRFDGTRRAMLLEKLEPGENLRTIFAGSEMTAVDVAIGVMQKLWREPPSENSFPKLEDWCKNGFRKAENANFAPESVRKAGRFFEELHSSGRRVLLHGDLHHENILTAGRERFLAIDPKGITGNFAYEITTFLLNHRRWLEKEPDMKEKLDAAIVRFAEAFKIASGAIRKWTFAQSVLSAWWTFEENSENWRDGLAEAEIWDV